MTMTPEQQRAIIARESAWIDDGSFGQLDLTAFPALNELPTEDQHEDKFAKAYGDTALSRNASALKAFINDPDAEALERVGDEIGSVDYLREVRDRKGETIAGQFKRKCPGYIPTQRNFETMVTTLAYNALSAAQQNGSVEEMTDDLIAAGVWTVPNLEATYRALEREGLLDVPAGTARNLSERERLRVARLAQAGRADEAIGEFLRCALDGEEATLEMVNDPAYRQVCDDAVLAVFEEITLDYVATPERQRYLLRHCGNRPLTLALLQQAWRACQGNEQRHERGELLEQYQRPQTAEPPSVKEIDALSDDQVDELFHSSLRAYANSVRQHGIIA
ncbi:MAG: hypothetical protein WBV55_23920 [Candidatus Sulfotelmatobacter sp.]